MNQSFRRYYQKLQPLFKRNRTRVYTTAVFSFLSISLFVWYAIRPTAQTIVYLRREIADKTVLNEQMENKISTLIEAQSTYKNIEHRLPIITQALPNNPDAVFLVRQLGNLASISGASIAAVQIPNLPLLGNEATPGAKRNLQSPLEEFPVTIVLKGPYASLKAFLDGLLALRRIVIVHSVSIKQGAKTLSFSELQLSLRLTSYYTPK